MFFHFYTDHQYTNIQQTLKYALSISLTPSMSDSLTFDKIINDFFIEIELTRTQPNEISFILVQDKHEQCYELRFSNGNLPSEVQLLFKSVRHLYDYLFEMQDNRSYFDISMSGHLIIKKNVADSTTLVFKTISVATTVARVKDLTEQCKIESSNEEVLHNYNEQSIHRNEGYSEEEVKRKCEVICLNAEKMIRNQCSALAIARNLHIREATVNKMLEQMKRFGRIIPPTKYSKSMAQQLYPSKPAATEEDPQNFTQQAWQRRFRQIGPITPNMKMHGQGVRGIKKLLYVLVKEGKMQSLDEMRNFLLERNIDRSLSSIYRYISSIKIENPQFQSRNYTMYRRDMQEGRKGEYESSD